MSRELEVIIDAIKQSFEDSQLIADKIRKEKGYADGVGISLGEIYAYMCKDLKLKEGINYGEIFQNVHNLPDIPKKKETRSKQLKTKLITEKNMYMVASIINSLNVIPMANMLVALREFDTRYYKKQFCKKQLDLSHNQYTEIEKELLNR